MNCTEDGSERKNKSPGLRDVARGHGTSFFTAGLTIVAASWFEIAATNFIFPQLRFVDFWLLIDSGVPAFVAGCVIYFGLLLVNEALRVFKRFEPAANVSGCLNRIRLLAVGDAEPAGIRATAFALVSVGILVPLVREIATSIPTIARLAFSFVNALSFAMAIVTVFAVFRIYAWRTRTQVPWHFVVVCAFIAFFFVYFDVQRFAALRAIGPATLVGTTLILIVNWYVRPRLSIPELLAICVSGGVVFGGIALSFDSEKRPSATWWKAYNAFGFGVWSLVDLSHDIDADGHGSLWGGADCRPLNSSVYPGAMETIGDGIDNNCGGGDLPNYEAPQFTGEINYRQTNPPTNVVMITVDTLRADVFETVLARFDLGIFEKFAAKSLYFASAYTPAPHTKEAMPALMGGVYPISWQQLGVQYGIEPTLAEILGELGYRREAVLGLPYFDGLTLRGFERVDNELGPVIRADSKAVVDSEIERKASERLESLSGEPFFLWVHFFDPHAFYATTPDEPELAQASEIERYVNEVRRTLRTVEAFLVELETRGLYEDSIIVFASDHGEGIFEHRVSTHAMSGYDSVIRVPLAIKAPGLEPRTVHANASLVDVLPTVLDLAGIEGQYVSDGISWVEGDVPEDRPVFFESSYKVAENALLRGVVQGHWKLIWDLRRNTYHLYDLNEDPNEFNNLIAGRPEIRDELMGTMHRHFDEHFNDEYLRAKTKVWDYRVPIEPDVYLGGQGGP